MSHRPLPAARPQFLPGAPDMPKGMRAASRRVWGEYVGRMAPLGILRQVDGFTLRRLCEDVAELQELNQGLQRLKAAVRSEAKAEGKKLRSGAAAAVASSDEGGRLLRAINTLATRVRLMEQKFGLTPLDGTRLEASGGVVLAPVSGAVPEGSIEEALCG